MRRVLNALGEALHDNDHGRLTRVDIRHGWGNVLNVRLHTALTAPEDRRELAARLRDAVDRALGDERHLVEIVWDSAG